MSRRRFHVGQKVVVVRAQSVPHLVGAVVTIIEDLHRARIEGAGGVSAWIYSIDVLDERGRPYGAFPEDLRPWYDGDQPGEWSELRAIWQPRGVGA